jgi:hypothetical protein
MSRSLQSPPLGSFDQVAILSRKPQRVTITVNWSLHRRLLERADREGRSLSNLMAHLLKVATAPKRFDA